MFPHDYSHNPIRISWCNSLDLHDGGNRIDPARHTISVQAQVCAASAACSSSQIMATKF